jgi:hypothetical protein
MNQNHHNSSFFKNARPGYLILTLAIFAYALWARQQDGFLHTSGLVLVLAGFAGVFVGSTHRSEFAGWLYGIGALVMMLLFFGGGFVLKYFGVI